MNFSFFHSSALIVSATLEEAKENPEADVLPQLIMLVVTILENTNTTNLGKKVEVLQELL